MLHADPKFLVVLVQTTKTFESFTEKRVPERKAITVLRLVGSEVYYFSISRYYFLTEI